MGDAFSLHDRAFFTTQDYDNDKASSGNCAAHFGSGWWFNNCYHVNLNGLYRTNGEKADARGIVWSEWRGLNISLQYSEMKIRPTTFSVL
ncbi:Techylectin-5B [Holothuria leucospilota]|uniref:Techylectin-5B n=1 Tax=Holothuria leucospilota TaxID=206669 RepID=A0A9Q1C9C2_HOLLE|nr:Techylectin-5B [Holothuria leucospilota]